MRKRDAGSLSQATRRSRGRGKPSLPAILYSQLADKDRSDSDENINDYRHKDSCLWVNK